MNRVTKQTAVPKSPADNTVIQAINASREYELEGETIHAIRSVNLDIRKGKFITLVGRLGSGKSTLFSLLAGLDHPTAGKVLIEEIDLSG